MKKQTVIRNFLLASAMALSVPMMAHADDDHKHGERGEHCEMHKGKYGDMKKGEYKGKRMEYMAKELGLSDVQRQQLKGLMETHHAEMRAERNAFMKQIDAILTPEQRQKAQEMRKRHEEKRADREERDDDDDRRG